MNIIVSGVGGQGLVLMTDMICQAAFLAGMDVKSNDVIGLSQRGGKVWGSIKFEEKVHSPNIEKGQADILVALEPLEGLRWQDHLKPEGKMLMNTADIYPVFAIGEQAPYPHDFMDKVRKDIQCHALAVQEKALEIGTIKIVNVIMLGMLAKHLPFGKEIWDKVIEDHVPSKFLKMNQEGFQWGLNQ